MAVANYIICPSFEHSSWENAGGQTWEGFHNPGDPFFPTTFRRQSGISGTRGTYALQYIKQNNTPYQTDGYFYLELSLPSTSTPKTWTFSFDRLRSSTDGRAWRLRVSDGFSTLASITISSGRNYIRFTQQPGETRFLFEFDTTLPGVADQCEMVIDSLRLCEGTETNYVDGSTAGFVWEGTAHLSRTLSAPSVTYNGVWNYWPRPQLHDHTWSPYWEASGQNANGMTVTNGANGVTVSGAVSRSGSTYRDIGAQSPILPLDNLPAGIAYLSVTVSNLNGLGQNDDIRVIIRFYDSSQTLLLSSTGILPRSGGRGGGPVTVPSGAVYASIAFHILTPSGYSSSSHTVTATFNHIRLATQNETNYIDGDTPGYGWKGQPNNSATIAAVKTNATGNATATGSIEPRTYSVVELSGTATATGYLEIWLTGVEAHGEAVATGELQLWPYGPASTSGIAQATGGLEAYILIDLGELTGSVTASGSARADIAVLTFSTGSASANGSIEFSVPPELQDTPIVGTATATGSVEIVIAGVTSASGEATATGSLDAGSRIPAGAFDNFAIFGIGENDPLKSATVSGNGGILTGASGQDWVYVQGSFLVPNTQESSDGVLWKRAAYVVPGIKFSNMPPETYQEFTYVQVNINPSSTFEPGASLRPIVYADRINVSTGTIAVLAEPGPNYIAQNIPSPIPGDTTPGLLVPVKVGQQLLIMTPLNPLRPGATYTASAYVKISSGRMIDLGIFASREGVLEPISKTCYWSQVPDDRELDGWRRLHITFTAPGDGKAVLIWDPRFWAQEEDEEFEVAGILVEEGLEVLPYFWPDGSQDVTYRKGSNNPYNGLFYYKNREKRTYILKRALEDHVPTGIRVTEPEFGILPYAD